MAYFFIQKKEGRNVKIVDKKRFVLFIIAILLLIVITALAIRTLNEERRLDHTEEYEIKSGETLWSIASNYRPSNMSIQEYIYNLEQFNQITPDIRPAQKIQILIYEEG